MKFGVGQSVGRTEDRGGSHWRGVLQSWCECRCWVADCFFAFTLCAYKIKQLRLQGG